MIVKTFFTKQLADAQHVIEKEFGPQGILLTSRPIKSPGLKGVFGASEVEITAAVDEEDYRAYLETIGQTEKLEEAVKAGSQFKVEHRFESAQKTGKMVAQKSGSTRNFSANLSSVKELVQKLAFESESDRLLFSEMRKLSEKAEPQEQNFSEQNEEEGLNGAAEEELEEEGKEEGAEAEVSEERSGTFDPSFGFNSSLSLSLLQVSKGLLDRLSLSFAQTPPEESEKGSFEKRISKAQVPGIVHFLVSKGVSHSLALEIVSRVNKRLGIHEMPIDSKLRTEMFNALKRELSSMIKTSGPLTLTQGQPKICAIVGPSGVGKSTIAMKIALQYTNELHKKVAVIVLKQPMDVRGGPLEPVFEPIENVANQFQIPLVKVTSVLELQETLKGFEQYDLILIDTYGCSQYHWQKVDELAGILSAINGLEIHLALSLTMKDIDVMGAVQLFSRLNIESLMFTKWDETIAIGVLVNVSDRLGKSVSYLTNGQQIPGDLSIAHGDEIARSLLVQHNTQEFDAIRQLARK